jgi:hypothetical protein
MGVVARTSEAMCGMTCGKASPDVAPIIPDYLLSEIRGRAEQQLERSNIPLAPQTRI